jgi:NADPH2:quinone reductase
VTFRTRSPDEFRAIVAAAHADLWPAVEAGKLGLPIDRTFALDEVTKALARMKANAHFGKIVLAV